MPDFILHSYHLRLMFLALLGLSLPAAAQQDARPDVYLDSSLPLAQRVDDLVSRMTLREKISQMQNEAPGIPRLHVAAYDWWNEGLHGVARSGYATVFPQAIGLAATWDPALVHRVADAISTEARAKYNQAQREDNHSIFYGLTMWSPNINIDRDPRWGRGQETYGEDPFLTSQIGSAFVQGLQGDDKRYLKVAATAKHFAVHSGPESERHSFDAVVSPHDLEDTYLPAFRALVVDAHAASVMCAYNAVDGSPACASDMLLRQKLRGDWAFHGYVVSDCSAISDVAVGHKFAPDMPHAAALSVKAGTDLSCGKEFNELEDAVKQGLIGQAEIDEAVKHLFATRFRLGMFDSSAEVPFNSIPFSQNDSPAHAALSLEAARASIVLLKNSHGVLPLSRNIKTIAVVGPNASSLAALEGNYNGAASHPFTPLAALERRMPGRIVYAQGAPYVDAVPVAVPSSVFSTVESGAGNRGLKAEYFNGAGFNGTRVLSRVDSNIDFDWNGASPVSGVSGKSFSVRWSGYIASPIKGSIVFGFSMAHCSTCEDSEVVRVWLDGKHVYDFTHVATHGRRAPTTAFKLAFSDTRPHPIRIEYIHDAAHFGAGLTFNWKPPAAELCKEAVAAASQADAIVAFLGLSPELEGEEMPLHVDGFDGGDRSTIEFPAVQQRLMDALASTGKPLVVVLMNGGALALGKTAQQASAVLEAWYPGQAGGEAIVDSLFGENNPSGRLPVTFYASTSQLPAFDDYSMKGRTYRYFTGTALYGFGFGLSYTSFQYSDGWLSATALRAGDSLEVSVKLKNTGDRDGSETVEVYLIPKGVSGAPIQSLVGIERAYLKKDETRTIHIRIDPRQLSLVDAGGGRSIQAGEYEIYAGGSQPSHDAGVFLPFRIEGTSPVAP